MRKQICVLLVLIGFFCACNSAQNDSPPLTGIVSFNEAKETEEIMKVIKGETDCFFKGDYECWANLYPACIMLSDQFSFCSGHSCSQDFQLCDFGQG